MNDLKKLIDICNYEVKIAINEHKNTYQKVKDRICDLKSIDAFFDDEVNEDVYNKMCELDTMVCVTAYPNTAVGFYVIYHYDVDKAISDMLETIKYRKGFSCE